MAKIVDIKKKLVPIEKKTSKSSENYDQLIRAGLISLTQKGFSSSGIEEILKNAKVPKGSFYYYFKSKEEFGLALIDSYSNYFARKLDKFFLDETLTPVERLEHFIKAARISMARYDFQRGCLVGNLGQEMTILPGSFRQKLIDVFTDWQHRTELCLVEAQKSGLIHSEIDCKTKAEFFWIGWEGAILRAKLERSAAPLDLFSKDFLMSLK